MILGIAFNPRCSAMGTLHRNHVVPVYGAVKKLHNKDSYTYDLFSITIVNKQSLQNWIEFT